jgi:hypothetical protein
MQRDFLLSLAVEGMYRPVWSAVILDELEYHEARKLINRGVEEGEATQRARRLVEQMRSAFDDAEVQGWEGLEGTYDLPDSDDEHVVAAAVVAGAGAIITHNQRDFPPAKIPRGIQVIPPQEFAANTTSLDPIRARAAVASMVERSGRNGPRLTEATILDILVNRYRMDRTVELIRQTH